MPLACDAVSSEKACACGRMRASALCGLGNGAPGSPGADLFAILNPHAPPGTGFGIFAAYGVV